MARTKRLVLIASTATLVLLIVHCPSIGNGYIMMVSPRRSKQARFTRSCVRATIPIRAVSLTAITEGGNDEKNEKTRTRNEDVESSTNGTDTSPPMVSRFLASLAKPLKRVLQSLDPPRRRNAKSQTKQVEKGAQKPINFATVLSQHFKLPHPGGVRVTKRKKQRVASDSALRNSTTLDDSTTSIVVRSLQQLLSTKDKGYPFVSTSTVTTTDSIDSLGTINDASGRPKTNAKTPSTSVLVRFLQRLLHRNGATSLDSTSRAQHSTGLLTMNETLKTKVSLATNTQKDSETTTCKQEVATAFQPPVGPRWAISAPTTDLSGKWKPIVSPEFKQEYEAYLKNCSQPFVFRNLCLNFVGLTREEITQDGPSLRIRGTSPVGAWDRTLVSSGSDQDSADYEPFNVTFLDPDGDRVHVEACWIDNGTTHLSWLRGKPRVCGGEFESTRYVESDNGGKDVLVCESTFHPPQNNAGTSKGTFRPAFVKWRFEREE